jgi:spore germination protein GerM
VVVYLFREDAIYTRAGAREYYVAAPRALAASERAAPLGAALRKLFSGPTREERRRGCSGFRNHEHVLDEVSLVDGRALVDFRRGPFLRELGNVSAASAGAIFTRGLELTIFEFPTVRSIQYSFDGDCQAFGDFMQAGECIVSRRRE